MGAAIASEAAHSQGKFRQYHDKLFANQAKLTPDDLKKFANAELNIMGNPRGFLALNSVSTANVEMKAILGSH
jgi:protein-disulfide isomerase